MRIENLYGKKVMVDTNAFVYYLTDNCNSLTNHVFEAGALGKIQLVTTTRIVDELLFKMLLIKAAQIYGWKTKILEKLKKDPQKIKNLADTCKKVIEFLETLNVEVIEIKKSTIWNLPEIITCYGLIGTDAITLKVMKERNLKYILTADEDFKNVEDLVILNPLN